MTDRHRRQAGLARLAILAATLIWATSFTIVQRALVDLPVLHLLAYRFTLATLLLLPLLARGLGGTRLPVLLRDGAVLGGLLFAGFVLQTSGLLWTTPSHSAFIVGLSVVIVPPLAWALKVITRWRTGRRGDSPSESASERQAATTPASVSSDGPATPGSGRRSPRLGPAAGAVCAALGLWVLFRPGVAAGSLAGAGAAAAERGFGRGDILTLVGTFAFACHILGIERAVRQRAAALAPLAVVQFAVVALLAAPSLVAAPPRATELTPFALFAIGVSGVMATAVAYLCQLYAQRHLAATETAVLLTFEPVAAALFSIAVGRDHWSLSLVLGGILILAAMLLSELGGGPEAVPPAVAAPSP
jgi:drug/metabolite transporter (DMT)-like permease